MAPIAFYRVGVDVASDVDAVAVTDSIMPVILCKPRVRGEFVGHDARAGFDALAHDALQGGLVNTANGPRVDLALALDKPDDGGLSRRDAPALPLALAADVRLVNFDGVGQLKGLCDAEGVADAVQHVPRALLRDTQVFGELAGRNTLLVRSEDESLRPCGFVDEHALAAASAYEVAGQRADSRADHGQARGHRVVYLLEAVAAAVRGRAHGRPRARADAHADQRRLRGGVLPDSVDALNVRALQLDGLVFDRQRERRVRDAAQPPLERLPVLRLHDELAPRSDRVERSPLA